MKAASLFWKTEKGRIPASQATGAKGNNVILHDTREMGVKQKRFFVTHAVGCIVWCSEASMHVKGVR